MAARPRVLVVDDDPGIRLLCRINLQLDGHAVVEAATLPDAREAIARDGADVVLLDLHVGGEDGRPFLTELRRTHPGLPVVLLTGATEAAEAARGAAAAVISKPFTLDDLRGTVARVAGRGG